MEFADGSIWELATENTSKELKSKGYHLDHTSMARGYESHRGYGHIETYKGRFGEGYKWFSPRWDTTSYVDVEYWVK